MTDVATIAGFPPGAAGRWLRISMAACILILPGLAAGAEQAPQARLEEVNAAIADIDRWLTEAGRELGSEEQALRRIQREIDAQRQAIAENREHIAALQRQQAELGQREAQLGEAVQASQALMARAVRASWVAGRENPLKLVLNQQDPARTARMLRYYADFNEARLAQVERYRQNLEALAETRRQMTERGAALEAGNAALREQLAALDRSRAERVRLISSLQQDMAERSDTLEALQADREQLEALVEEINRIVIDIPSPGEARPFEAARGELPWPVEGPALNGFGDRYSDGNLERRGIIIASPAGTPVRAIHQGRVVFADWLRGSGLLVIVDHGNGYISLYAHNGALDKRSGDWVNRGEPLATAGDDAGMDSPGIYFEIRHNGEPQDPVHWLQKPRR